MKIIQALTEEGVRWIRSHANGMKLVVIPSRYAQKPAILHAAGTYVDERFMQKTNQARTKEGEFAITLAGVKNIQKAIDCLAKESDGKTAVVFEDLQIPQGCRVIKMPKKAKEKEFQDLEELAIASI